MYNSDIYESEKVIKG